jgi:hypothetical protein
MGSGGKMNNTRKNAKIIHICMFLDRLYAQIHYIIDPMFKLAGAIAR